MENYNLFKKVSLFVAIPLYVYLLGMFGCILFVAAQLGHLPVYGADPDPTVSGLMLITFFLILIFIGLFCVLPLWLISGITLSIQEKSWKVFLNPYTIAIISGIVIYIAFRIYMPSQFAWYMD